MMLAARGMSPSNSPQRGSPALAPRTVLSRSRKRPADWTHGPRDQIPFLLQVPPGWVEPGKRCGMAAQVEGDHHRYNPPDIVCGKGRAPYVTLPFSRSTTKLPIESEATRAPRASLSILSPCAAGLSPAFCICQSNAVDCCRAAGARDLRHPLVVYTRQRIRIASRGRRIPPFDCCDSWESCG